MNKEIYREVAFVLFLCLVVLFCYKLLSVWQTRFQIKYKRPSSEKTRVGNFGLPSFKELIDLQPTESNLKIIYKDKENNIREANYYDAHQSVHRLK